ncbi:hypothetical protein QR680_006913 [Steinernema hermaphroditum]|uniref:Uncharacterized protein n=1 Tax=Steinernema hermaphroditum TaxID=289476 RepID=A0AA39HX13_9BILA|nr:hypothetical protein QR680_006913 [Steinernema hermaphroditum]
MRELSRQLSQLLGTIKKRKEKEGTFAKTVYEVVDTVTVPPTQEAQVVVLREVSRVQFDSKAVPNHVNMA